MEKIYLWSDENIRTAADRPAIKPFLIEDGKLHPAVMVIPGGGYACVCESTEGTPTARRFNELGFHAFVLDYRVAPNRFPLPQADAARAVRLIRGNAEKWRIIPDQIAVCGFSAGAHLAASIGVFRDEIPCDDGDRFDAYSFAPDVMFLCYGVLVFAEWSHLGSQKSLLGENFRELRENFSLSARISESTPPAFVMHTIRDQAVPFENSIEFVRAMAEHKIPCELALYCWGDHGMLLGNDTADVSDWPYRARAFMESLKMCKNDPEGFRERYTHAYQAAGNLKMS